MGGPWHGQWELPVLGIAKDGQTVALPLAGRGDTAHPQGEQERDVYLGCLNVVPCHLALTKEQLQKGRRGVVGGCGYSQLR